MATTAETSVAAHPKFEPVIGLEVHVQLVDGDQDLLFLLDALRGAAE